MLDNSVLSSSTAPRTWLFSDYNQAESRIVARLGPVPKLDQWYREGVDVHTYVARLIAKTVQENHITMPSIGEGRQMFKWKPWDQFGKGDDERDTAKRCVHGNNYDMGIDKLALVLGCDLSTATILHRIYHALFPEIRGNYHAWVRRQLLTTKTIWTPEPVRFRKVFHTINSYSPLDDNTLRSAYSCYPQCTVGYLLVRTLNHCCRVFNDDILEKLADQWKAWYGKENWDTWRRLRDSGLRTPQAILWGGMHVRTNTHDEGGISIPNDPDLVRWAATEWKRVAEVPLKIRPEKPEDDLIIPVNFKIGPTMASTDLKDYKLDKAA